MATEKVVPYPGVDEADAVNVETDKLQEKRRKLWSKREDKREREEDRSIEKELKQLDYEEKHPTRVRVKKRLRTTEKGVRKQVGNAWRHAEGVAKDVAMYRKANPPRVIPRPRGMRMAPPPSARSNMSREETVSPTLDRDFFGSNQQPGQEKDFFGPPKLLDLIGGGNAPKKEVDYIGNKKKKETRYF